MSQISLNITPCLAYSPDNFLLHRGVEALFHEIISLLRRPEFRLCFVSGGPRCGKTHFSIKLADALMRGGYCPRLLEGAQAEHWIRAHLGQPFHAEDVLIIDEAEVFLSSIQPGGSGEIVALIERLRVSQAALVFLSRAGTAAFGFDAHLRSRLDAGAQFQIGAPAAEDISALLERMARQRGLALSQRKVGFLERRLGRDIGSLEEYLERVQTLSRALGQPIRFPLLGDAI